MQQLALTADCEELLLAGEEDEARKVCVVPCTDAGEKCEDGSSPLHFRSSQLRAVFSPILRLCIQRESTTVHGSSLFVRQI